LNITDALNFVERIVPGTVAHKIAAAEQLLEAHKSEFVRATSQLSALASQSAQLESYLDTIKSRIDAAEADLGKLKTPLVATPAAPVQQTPPAAQATSGVVTTKN
jgi:hypothetical protein